MSEKVTSRLAGFHKLPFAERLNQIGRMFRLSSEELEIARGEGSLAPEIADRMIENAIGTFSLPLGVGLNLTVNGRDYWSYRCCSTSRRRRWSPRSSPRFPLPRRSSAKRGGSLPKLTTR